MARVPHRLLEGCLIAAHAIESKDVFIYIRGEYLTEYEILQAAVDEAREAGLFGEVNVTVYRGAGAYICGEETALLDSLEGRRGQPRPRPPFPPVQGLYMAPTEINNVCTIATVPAILELGADGFDQVGTPELAGHRPLLDLRQRREARQLRARARHLDARADLHARGRDRRRPPAEGGHPRRLLGAGADRATDRRAARLRLAGRDRDVLRRRLADRGRRALLHGAARAALDEVLHARVLRQVHAVPRGDALAGAAPGEARARRRWARRPRPAAKGLRPDRGQVALRARRLRGLARAELLRQVERGVRRPRRAGRVPVGRRVLARGHLRAVGPAHALAACAEVPA